MLRQTILDIFSQTWPTIAIAVVIIVSLRIVYLIKNRDKFILYQELFMLLFIIYILCLFYIVTFQDVSWSSSNYVPFHEMFRYEFGSRLFFKNVVGNVILFIPYGFFAAYFLKEKKLFPILILSILVSLTIETTQLLIGRVFDIDDILLNVIGSLIGYMLYKLMDQIKEKLPNFLRKPITYNIILIIIIVLVILYLINLGTI